jgi:DHA1 family multidrug resistance protein-like MFS transporter
MDFYLPVDYLEPSQHSQSPAPSTAPLNGDIVAGNNKDDVLVVGWYSDIDHDSPFNWSFGKKLWVAMLLFVYTFSVYITSSLHTSSS